MLKTAVFKYKLVVGVGWRVLLIFVLFFVLFLSDCNFCQMTILVFIKLKIARFDFAIYAGNPPAGLLRTDFDTPSWVKLEGKF